MSRSVRCKDREFGILYEDLFDLCLKWQVWPADIFIALDRLRTVPIYSYLSS
jgi:hypothetical protein